MRTYARLLLLAAIAAVSATGFSHHAAADPLPSPAVNPSGGTVAPAAPSWGSTSKLAALLGAGAARNLAADATPFAQPVQAVIAIAPDTVDTGSSPTVTLTSSGFFDLSQINVGRIGVRPADGISGIAIVSQSAQHLTLSMLIAGTATAGTRTLFILNSQDETVVALDLTLNVGQNVCNPSCTSPAICRNNTCVTPPPPTPPPVCNPACDEEATCVSRNQCVDRCSPHCGAGLVCRGGRCVRAQ